MRPAPSDIVVLGAGLAGLSAAYHLGGEVEIFEKEGYVGGHSRTKRVDGFNFDEGAHVFFGKDECSEEFVWKPLGASMRRHRAEIWNNYGGRSYGRYPVQANAHALPPEQATRCLLDFIAASHEPERDVSNYEDWCYASFGKAFSDDFMLRYARKVWTVEPSELTTEWLGSKVGGRISRPSLEQVVRGAIDAEPQEINYLTDFWYPEEGGFGRISGPVASGAHRVNFNRGVTKLETNSRRITFADGSSRNYHTAISTIPLPELIELTVDAPDEVRSAGQQLMWTSIRCVNFGIASPQVGRGHWVYFYDHDIPFFRISFPSTFAEANAPNGCSSVSCEVAYSRRKPLAEEGLSARCLTALHETGVLNDSDQVIVEDQIDIPYAYVVFDHNRAKSLSVIHSWMNSVGLVPCGRFGEWGYHWSFEAIESGRRVAAMVANDGR